MVLAYFISSILAMIGLSGLLFYKLGTTTARRRMIPNNSYYIPHIVRHIEDSAPSIFLSKSTKMHNSESVSDPDKPQIQYIKTQKESKKPMTASEPITYKHITKRMTLVNVSSNPRGNNA
jgi:hypothetical protein